GNVALPQEDGAVTISGKNQHVAGQDPQIQCGEEAVVLNKSSLKNIASAQMPGAPNLLAKIIQLYLESSPVLVENIGRSIEQKDRQALENAAHSLKSSSANLGATELAQLCKTIEHQGKSNLIDMAAPLLEQLILLYNQTKAALEHELKEQGND
ncbi:MAG: Hpt domain-containing protein, partial [Colwellia sp.]